MNNIQEHFERALQGESGSDPFSQLVRESLKASAQQFSALDLQLTPAATALSFRLSDSLAPGKLIGAADAGDMLQRLQKAVARIARARRLRLPDVAKLVPADIEYARLDVAVSRPGSLIVGLTPHLDLGEADQIPTVGMTWAEIGAVELIRALPEHADDDQSLDSLLDASPVVRRAVADLITKRSNVEIDLSFTLARQSGEEVVGAILTSRQSRLLAERLNVVREEREVIRLVGLLDGVRTRRQIFYFEPRGSSEIHGFVDESLVGEVKRHLGLQVELALETFILRSPSGRRSQRRYRLIEVAGHSSQLPPDGELDEDDEQES